MKKLFCLTVLSALLFFSPFIVAYADDEGDEIDVTVLSSGESDSRTINTVPIQAFYYSTQSMVQVRFSDNIGDVTIQLTNITTGDSGTQVCDSYSGSTLVPVIYGRGTYCIGFSTAGEFYIGYFNVL